ncbi:MAG: triose-phosphate isomerase [bacterium]|nr:triose-phosphate isomerase [bacterium]
MSPLFIANWKMQLSDVASVALAQEARALAHDAVTLVLCPSFNALADVAVAIAGSDIALGAQDCAWEERGALTGEVSPEDLKQLGCTYVLVGHSERRRELGETDALVGKKLRAACAAGLMPVLCVGEDAAERAAGKRGAVIARQCSAGFDAVADLRPSEILVAYEPVWAIGTGVSAAPEDAAAAAVSIAALAASHDIHARVLYGGSVDADSVGAFMARKEIAGVLVGTASQTATGLRDMIVALQAVT